MRISKASFLLFTLLIAFLAPLPTLASHNMGIDVRIECVNACSSRIYFRAYRDCTGAVGANDTPFWRANGSNCPNAPTQLSTPTMVTTEVTPVCPLEPTQCTNPNAVLNGVQEYAWDILYNTCNASPCQFDLFYQDCCRNGAITSLSVPGSLSIGVLVTGIDLTNPTCNNSPILTNPPVLHLCAGQGRTYDMGGYDVDGDSLAYSLATCLVDSAMTPVPYLPGFTPTTPLGPNWGVTLHPTTGLLHFSPQPGPTQVGVVCVTTSEYRNGNLIATNTRDMQVVVVNCNGTNNPPQISGIAVSTGSANVVGNHVYACAQTPLCLDISALDPDTGQVFSYFWDQTISGATFTDASNPSITDTVWSYFGNVVTGRFCLPSPMPGTYMLRLSLRDNFCPIPSGSDTIVWIHIVPQPFAQATATAVGCLQYDFSGLAGGCGTSGNMSYQWSGGGGISSASPNFTHHFGQPGVYPWRLIVDDGQGFRDTIRDTVVAVQTLNWATFLTGGVPLDPCIGPTSCVLDAGTGFANYQWSTGASTQSITVSSAGTYQVTVEEPNGCLLRDTEVITSAPAELSGTVTTHLGQPMINQRVRLLKLQPSPLALLVLDSTLTDANGHYEFCGITDTTVYVKVHPSQTAYPLDMPTYADSALVWNVAHSASPLLFGAQIRDIYTIYGQNPGGAGSLGGTVLQGSNKVDSIGDPVPGLRLFLRNVGLGQIVGYRDTDVNGYFLFTGLPIATYEVIPDFPYVDENLPPVVVLSNLLAQRNQLDFLLHPTWLELLNTIGNEDPQGISFSMHASPNPVLDRLTLALSLPAGGYTRLAIYDMAGRALGEHELGTLRPGNHEKTLDISQFASGLYFLRVQVGAEMRVLRIIKG